MHPSRVAAAVADITRIFSFTLLLPFLAALIYEPYDLHVIGALTLPSNALTFVITFGLLTAFWVPIKVLTRRTEDQDLQDREAYLTVGVGWLVLTIFASVPFLLSGVLDSPVDAFFEAMSGLTTTGATVIDAQLESVPKSVMLWRAELQFLGGMGIIVLSVALLARLTQGGLQLLQAEAPGPSVTRIRPKLAQTAKTLWIVYLGVSGLLFVILLTLLRVDGWSWGSAVYDAMLHSFTTLSTGGFSNHGASIGYFDSWLFEAVIILFMLVAGSNFTLIYYGLHGDWKRLMKDPEWRFFMGSFLLVTLATTGLLWHAKALAGDALGPAFRGAIFNAASIATSTGLANADDFAQWPHAGRILMLILMLTGATAGSTSGGIKHVRILLLLRIVRRQLRLLMHPRAVIPIRLGGRTIKEETLMTVVAFFFAYLTIAMAGSIFVTANEASIDLAEGVSAGISMMGNTGPGLGELGPSGGYWDLKWSSKLVLSGLMWFGRLEVFAALLIFNPQSWKH